MNLGTTEMQNLRGPRRNASAAAADNTSGLCLSAATAAYGGQADSRSSCAAASSGGPHPNTECTSPCGARASYFLLPHIFGLTLPLFPQPAGKIKGMKGQLFNPLLSNVFGASVAAEFRPSPRLSVEAPFENDLEKRLGCWN